MQDFCSLDDNKLLSLYHENNQNAVTELIERYKPLINKVCSPYIAFLDSQDIKQEAYLGLLSAIMSYNESNGASFSTYASVCVKNKVKNFLISTQTKKSLFFKDTLSLDELSINSKFLNSDKNNPENIFIKREEYSLLINIIDSTLSSLEKDILFLHLNGFNNKDICGKLTVSSKTVFNALSRAKIKLKKFLAITLD